MKTTRRRQSNSFRTSVGRQRMRRFVHIGFAVAVAATLLVFAGIALRRVVARVGVPFLRVGSAFGETALLTASRDELATHVRALLHERDAFAARVLANETLMRENEHLRALLGSRGGSEVFSRTASVVVRPPETPYGLLVVDMGSRDGVVIGDIVRTAGREHLGEVIALEETSAKVRIYSAPDEARAVLVGERQMALTAKGLGGSWRIELPQAAPIAVGDALTGVESGRPIYGYVTHIDDRAGDPFKYAYAAPSVNINELTWVDIVRYE